MDNSSARRKRIAALTVVLPILAGIVIVVAGHLFGEETKLVKPQPLDEPQRSVALEPAAAGTPAPHVHLDEGATGKRFDPATLEDTPYAVVFISTRCGAIGGYLHRTVAELQKAGTEAIVLAISADAATDTRQAVRAWLARHHLERGPFHYLVGTEAELRTYWTAWGFNGPAPTCADSIPAHLVSASDDNTGVVDLDPEGPAKLFTGVLTDMSK